MEHENQRENKTLKKKFSLSFPWWFKVIAYVLAVILSAVSLFFIIVVGIEFGDLKVSKWLTSLVVSVLTSIFITHPLQVKKIIVNKVHNLNFNRFSIQDCSFRAVNSFCFAKAQ